MLGALGALAVTLGLLFVGLHLLRRMHGVRVPGRGIPLEILQRVSTGPRQGVALLRVDDRVLVVSLAEKGCTLLTELSASSASKALTAQRLAEHGDEPRSAARPFASVRMSAELGKFTALARRIMPLVLAGVARARTGPAQTPAARGPQPAAPAPTPRSTARPSPRRTVVNVAPFSPAPARRPDCRSGRAGHPGPDGARPRDAQDRLPDRRRRRAGAPDRHGRPGRVHGRADAAARRVPADDQLHPDPDRAPLPALRHRHADDAARPAPRGARGPAHRRGDAPDRRAGQQGGHPALLRRQDQPGRRLQDGARADAGVHAGQHPGSGRRRLRRDERRRRRRLGGGAADRDDRRRVRDQRAPHRVPDGLRDLPPVRGGGPDRRVGAHEHGHVHAPARDGVAAVQAPALRSRRRLDARRPESASGASTGCRHDARCWRSS